MPTQPILADTLEPVPVFDPVGTSPSLRGLAETGAVAPVAYQRPARSLTGRGRSFASFGEVVQGRLSNGEDFLVTLPIDMWSRCFLVCDRQDGPSTVRASLGKCRRAAEAMLEALGMTYGVRASVEVASDIPVGKGLSSSTADMLAVVRAFGEASGVLIPESCVSRVFALIEPHDGLHYPSCVAYNHRAGKLLRRLDHVPGYAILAIDAGGQVCTEEYNRRLVFSPDDLRAYDRLLEDLNAAFAARDDRAIARCATRSAELHAQRTGNRFLSDVLEMASSGEALGVVATHSGTCAGLLLPKNTPAAALDRLEASARRLGRVFRTATLPVLA